MRIIAYLLLCFWSACTLAHKPSDSYLALTLTENQLSGRWDIALRDLDFAIGLDSNDDGAITWGEVRLKSPEIWKHALATLQLSSTSQTCNYREGELKIDRHTDGHYAVLYFFCDHFPVLDSLAVNYRLFAEIDPQHRGLLNLSYGKSDTASVLDPNKPVRIYNISENQTLWAELVDFIHEGIWHIWIGFDHILFLFSLLIPSVMLYQKAEWQPVADFKKALWDVIRVVTAFTVAHSITLSIAALGILELPSRWVESIIAASVILAALNNLVPIFTEKRVRLAFIFGLIHGFGFASVLTDLNLKESSRLWGLFGFNLGVEIGQLALVALFLPITYQLSRYSLYKPVVLRCCSAGIASLASIWFYERAFNTSLNIFKLAQY
ncbi:hypothetical protein MCAMS1_00947 [biofilm metagenome]